MKPNGFPSLGFLELLPSPKPPALPNSCAKSFLQCLDLSRSPKSSLKTSTISGKFVSKAKEASFQTQWLTSCQFMNSLFSFPSLPIFNRWTTTCLRRWRFVCVLTFSVVHEGFFATVASCSALKGMQLLSSAASNYSSSCDSLNVSSQIFFVCLHIAVLSNRVASSSSQCFQNTEKHGCGRLPVHSSAVLVGRLFLFT